MEGTQPPHLVLLAIQVKVSHLDGTGGEGIVAHLRCARGKNLQEATSQYIGQQLKSYVH